MELGKQSGRFRLSLLGPFCLRASGSEQIAISSKKGAVLIAMLATAPNGERSRGWLQEKLWGSRQDAQARASLRRELSNLRRVLNGHGDALISFDTGPVRLRLDVIETDVTRTGAGEFARRNGAPRDADFLEGMDIRGEEGFEDWLKQMRSSLSEQGGRKAAARDFALEGFETGAAEFGTDVVVHTTTEWSDDQGRRTPAEGIAEELVGLLARYRWMKAHLGIKADRGREPSDAPAGRHGGYCVQVAQTGPPAASRVDVSLWTAARQLLWSVKFDLPIKPEDRDRTLAVATAQLGTRVEREEQARAHRSPGGADFSHAIWRGRWHVNRLTVGDAIAARRLFDQAQAAAPRSPEALIQSATALCWEKWARRAPRHQFAEIRDLSRRAILLDPDDCRGYWLAGVAETWLRNPAASIGLLTHAIELNRSFEPAHAQLGSTLNLFDRPKDALNCLTHALELSPNDTHVFFRYAEIGLSWSRLGDQARAIDWLDRALLQRPAYWYARILKINALVEADDLAGARAAGRELRTAHPKFGLSDLEWVPFFDPASTDRLRVSLTKADVFEATGRA